MSRFARLTAFCSLILALTLTNQVSAQVTPGFPPFSAFESHELDTVDLMNNNVILRVPIMSKPGAIDFGVAANSYMAVSGITWSPSLSFGVNSSTGAPFTGSAYGLLARSSVLANWTTSWPGPNCSDGSPTTWLSGFSFTTSDGTVHLVNPGIQLQTAQSDSICHNQNVTTPAVDGSGLIAEFNSLDQGLAGVAIVYLRNGAYLQRSSLTDRYGNSLTALSGCGSTSCNYQDKMGLTVLSMSTPNGITQPRYSWTDVNSGTPHVDQSTTNLTLKTNFACSGITDLNNSSTTAMTSGFSFPDGTSLAFTYEGTPGSTGKYTGRINQITQREGGTVSYTYGGANHGVDCTYQTAPVLTRTLGNGDQTTYTLTHSLISGSNYGAVNTVVDPGGNKTIYTFTGFTSTGIAAAPTAQAVTEVQHFQGSSTPLTTDVYCYNTVFSSCSFTSAPTTTVTLPVTSKIIMHKINGMTNTSATEYHYDTYGNITYVASYDFGATSPTLATTITYGTCSAGCNTSSPTIIGIGSNIYSLQGEILTTQNGNTVAQTNSAYNSSGSLLTTYKWTGSQWLSNSTPNVYNSNGSISKTYDLANNETDYSYSASSYIGCSACTSFPFPTQVKNASTGNYINSTWYGVGAVKSADTDRNGNTTTYCYNTGANCTGGTADPYWRVLQTVDPYSSTVISAYPTGTSPDTQSSSFTFNSSNSISSTALTTDGYGRTIRTQTAQSPTGSNYDTTSLSYSWNSGYFTVNSSQPCSTTLGADCTTVHASEFDALGRLYSESTTSNETFTHTYTQNDDLAVLTPAPSGETSTGKQVQNQYDGLGRLTSSCLISSTVSGNVLCNQSTNTSAHGVMTSISYSSAAGTTTVSPTRGSQTRSQTVDALGRLTQKVTPEGGTWNYYYDTTSPSCSGGSASAGNLVCSKDPNGNSTIYFYDSLNRLTDVGAGVSTTTICKRFRYDNTSGVLGSIPTGITVSNPYGKLVEAETDDCSSPITAAHQFTDEWFSYDKDGNITDIWELTPHSTQYYHSTATFAANGVITSLQLVSPSLYTINYTLDGEGRWNTLAKGSSSMVTGPTQMYNAAGQPTEVDLTGSDKDTYVYDPNTGNMTQYVFQVGSANETGVLNWNPNNTLQQLAITDGFNSGGSQTCASSYDDLVRLIVFDCGSGNWGQDFGYDQYNNLAQTVISGRSGGTWNPGYNSSNNQVTGATYDASGDMTNDGGMNVYGYDQFNKLAWTAGSGTPTCGTNGKCITYDAFGRMVEKSIGSVWSEIWYTQVPGSLVNMSGTVANYGYWPSPGRGTFLATGSNLFLHQDWLGNDRVVSYISNHTVAGDRAYAPYGEQYNTFGGTNPIYGMFAGITGDFDSGVLFDTRNRELAQYQGRWISPDPVRAGWNQYAYSTNPNSEIDPLGLSDCVPDEWHDCGTFWGPGNPGNGCSAGDASCGGGGGNFWDGGSGTPNSPFWNMSQMEQDEASYDAWVMANWLAGGETIYGQNGVNIAINWSIEGGVYGINLVNGMTVDAAGLAELIGTVNESGSNGGPGLQSVHLSGNSRLNQKSNLNGPSVCRNNSAGAIEIVGNYGPLENSVNVQTTVGFPEYGQCIAGCYVTEDQRRSGTHCTTRQCAATYIPLVPKPGPFPGVLQPKPGAPTLAPAETTCVKLH